MEPVIGVEREVAQGADVHVVRADLARDRDAAAVIDDRDVADLVDDVADDVEVLVGRTGKARQLAGVDVVRRQSLLGDANGLGRAVTVGGL